MKIKKSRIKEIIEEEFIELVVEKVETKLINEKSRRWYYIVSKKIKGPKKYLAGVIDGKPYFGLKYNADRKDSEKLLNKQIYSIIDDKYKSDLLTVSFISERQITEALDKNDYKDIRDLIRAEVAAIFFTLFKKKQIWL